MFYKALIKKEMGRFVYPVPDVNKIWGAKYRLDYNECVFAYPQDLPPADGLKVITEAEYNSYAIVTLTKSKSQLAGDGVDTVNITLKTPEAYGEELYQFFVNDELVAFKEGSISTATIPIQADSSMIGTILKIRASSQLWGESGIVFVEVV